MKLRSLLEAAANPLLQGDGGGGGPGARAKDFYAACSDVKHIEEFGAAPLRVHMAGIRLDGSTDVGTFC